MPKITFLLSPFLLLILFLLQNYNNILFSRIISEDNLIEYSQFFILLFSAILSVFISLKLHHKKKISKMFLFIALGFAFVAFEEISWGQRLLGIETPEYLEDINVQKETTIHNIYFIHNIVGYGYIILAGYAAFSWILKSLLSKSAWQVTRWISPPWYLMTFFLPSLIYNISGHFIPIQTIWSWAEISELMLHLGLLLSLLYLHQLIPHTRRK